MIEGTARVIVIGTAARAELERVLAALPPHANIAVIAHCTDEVAAEQLATPLRATDVRSHAAIEPGTLYLVPTDCQIEVRDRAVVVTQSSRNNTLDILLRSVANQFGAQSVAVILSGVGTSGVHGVRRIREVGGITIAQAGVVGERGALPQAAIASGAIDLVLPVADIATRLAMLAGTNRPTDDRGSSDTAVDTLRDILALLRVRSGHDFASYKRATLFRRVSRRMQVCQVESIGDYLEYLRREPAELANLLRDFLISVTNFFRDPEAFDVLERNVIPKVFARKQAGEQVRVWVPGCASGEEAYSIAILLAEHAAKQGVSQSLQLFATDIDEESLADARQGRYPESVAVDVSEARLERFFMRENGYYRVCKELRDMVLFSPHNLLRDPPFSRLDLISCRNLLIYLNREAQDRVFHLFHFGLVPDGFLFLGSSETADNSTLFAAIDAKSRVFQRGTSSVGQGLDARVQTRRWYVPAQLAAAATTEPHRASAGELHYRIVEHYAPPSVLVNADLDIMHVSERAGRFLEYPAGEPTKQLLRLVIAPLRLEVRSAIHAAKQVGRGTETRVVHFDDEDGNPRVIEIRVVAAQLDDVAPGALLVLFDEKQPHAGSPEPLAASVDTRSMEPMVRGLVDELQRTRDQLRATIEQYETSLEELKASNEELQAINEELRSATEELETSKEELQSVNQELTTLNHELKVKVDEVSHANSDLQNLMTATDIGVLFLDRQLNIKRFTPRVQALFNVIPTDVGRPLAHLTHHLVTQDLVDEARTVVQTLHPVEREVSSRDARRYLMRILPYRSLDDRIDGVVVTFFDSTDLYEALEARHTSAAALRATDERLRLALGAAPMVVFGIAREGTLRWGYALGKETRDADVTALFAPGHRERFATICGNAIAAQRPQRAELDLVVGGTVRTYDFRFDPSERGVDAVGFDVTSSKTAASALLAADRRKDELLATFSHELRAPLMPLKAALDDAQSADGDAAKRAQAFAVIGRQLARIEQLVEELVDVSRIT